MNIIITNIEMDVSIQCRAAINTGIVSEYAERMIESDQFPPVELYGTKDQCWIGDGWHRVMAAKQIGAIDIPATLHAGGRADALKHALGANATHGHRRTNADKRRTVEIALREFPGTTDRAIAEMCGVDHKTVTAARVSGGEIPQVARTGQDGKKYPARKAPRDPLDTTKDVTDEDMPDNKDSSTLFHLKRYWRQAYKSDKNKFQKWINEYPATRTTRAVFNEAGKEERLPSGALKHPRPPCNGMQFARMAIMDLEQIRPDDMERDEAFDQVEEWLRTAQNGGGA